MSFEILIRRSYLILIDSLPDIVSLNRKLYQSNHRCLNLSNNNAFSKHPMNSILQARTDTRLPKKQSMKIMNFKEINLKNIRLRNTLESENVWLLKIIHKVFELCPLYMYILPKYRESPLRN
jgi:hypothetical protein